MKKRIEIDTFLEFQFVSNPGFSPDGTKAAFVVQKANLKENNYPGDIYLLDVENKKTRQLTAGGDAKSYVWTPEGTLLFAAKRTKEDKEAKEETVFYEIDPNGGEAQKAFSLPLKAGRIVPVDSDLYVVSATQNNGQPEQDRAYEIIEESPFWFNGRGFTAGLRGRIYLYQRSTKELTPITEPFFDAGGFEVKNRQILYRGGEWKSGLKYQYSGIYLYDIDSKTTKCLMEPDTHCGYTMDFWTEGKIMLGTQEDTNPGMYYDDFYVMDIESGKLEKLAEYDHSIGGSSVGSDARLGGGRGKKMQGEKWYFISTVDDGAYLRSITMDGQISGNLTPDGSLDSFDINDSHLLTCGMYGNKLAELYLDGEQVTHFNDWFEEEYNIITPEYHTYVGSDGVEIHGWAMKPAGYEEAKAANPDQKFPCILHVHGGPRTVFGSIYHHEMQMWANAGFYVIFCNPRGSDGRGGEFADICGKYGTVDYDNLMEFTDEMLKKYPDIDPTRLGETGGSYGGFMTNWIIGHTDRFAAACSQRSIANWTVFEHTSDIGYSFTKNHQGTRTRDDMEKLWWHSPLKYADKCKTPTLFIHSDRDYRCWMAEGLSMFTALKMHGCESRLVLFHDETHELSRSGKPQNRIRRMEEIVGWMKKYLMA